MHLEAGVELVKRLMHACLDSAVDVVEEIAERNPEAISLAPSHPYDG